MISVQRARQGAGERRVPCPIVSPSPAVPRAPDQRPRDAMPLIEGGQSGLKLAVGANELVIDGAVSRNAHKTLASTVKASSPTTAGRGRNGVLAEDGQLSCGADSVFWRSGDHRGDGNES